MSDGFIRAEFTNESIARINAATVKICEIFRNSNMSLQEALGTVMLLAIKLTVALNGSKESLTRSIDSNWDATAGSMNETMQKGMN